MSTSTGPHGFNRWWVVVGAVLIQLCLGAIYAWSAFTNDLLKEPFLFTKTQTQAIFSVGLASFAIVMVLAGRWQARSGPRIVALTGGLVLGAGYILAGLLKDALFGHFINQLVFIGIIGGAGIGLGYVCPIAVGIKWFPDKKGLITGLGVAGFGFGALIWIKLAGDWGHLLERLGVSGTFVLYGALFAAAVVLGSLWMVNPPPGYRPAGWQPTSSSTASNAIGGPDLGPSQMLRQGQFYVLWLMFVFSAMAGLMTIGNIKLFSTDRLREVSQLSEGEAEAIAGTAMGVFYSIANGLGRIIWGSISDRIGRKAALVAMCVLQGLVMLVFFWMGGNPVLLYLGATLIGFNFGGNFALFPTVTADLFGERNVGLNYGWVFTAYGVGGILGPIMAAQIVDHGLSWQLAFVIAGAACLLAAVLGLAIHRPPIAPKESALPV